MAVAGAPGSDGGGESPDAGSGNADAGSESEDAGGEPGDAGGEPGDAGGETDAGVEPGDAGADGGEDAGVTDPCSFTVSAQPSVSIPTVVTVTWATALPDLVAARIVYELSDGPATALNHGGIAPVELGGGEQRTQLVGLKPSQNYTFHVEATSASGTTCRSADQALATGALSGAPSVTRHAVVEAAQARGFIVTCGGFGSSGPAVMIDADGDVVWASPAPVSCSRARLDYAAKNVWMLATNPSNSGGDLRVVSLDGQSTRSNFAGLERAHHDLIALEDGGVAVFVWSSGGLDPESDLIAVTPDGATRRLFHVGSNLYAGGQSAFGGNAKSYHCNSVTHRVADGSFTIGDRNPNLFVHVDRNGTPLWQFGGSCSNARAPLCAAGSWQINHGHHLLDDGTFVFFNNTSMGATTASNALEFQLTTSGAMGATAREQWPGTAREHSDTLGDVQRLPNGNTLVTFSNNGMIYELDPAWNVVQTLAASSFGYSEWRETLYGAPSR